MSNDQCQHCTVRGDFDACQKTPCNLHESWYAVTMQAKIAALEADAARLDFLDSIGEAYGFEDTLEGYRWMVDGPFNSVRASIDDAMKGGA